MESIQLNKAIPELNDQLTFLIRREFYVTYNKYRKPSFYLLGLTILVIALATLTKTDSFVTLKALSLMLTAIVWFVTLIFLVAILVKRHNRNIWKQKTIKEIFLNDTKFQFAFDEEKLYFVTDNYSTDIKWNYYKYYAIDKNSIFIFPPKNIYEALSFSQNELGIDNYERLKTIVSAKLILLDNKNGT